MQIRKKSDWQNGSHTIAISQLHRIIHPEDGLHEK